MVAWYTITSVGLVSVDIVIEPPSAVWRGGREGGRREDGQREDGQREGGKGGREGG